MSSSLPVVIYGMALIAMAGIVAGFVSGRCRREPSHLPHSLALRDDTVRDPLAGPLRHGYAGAQIGVWLDDAGRLQVGALREDHDPGNALGPLVFRRLAERVSRHGSVYPGQPDPFLLMIDIVETEPARQELAYRVLDRDLRRYPDLFTSLSEHTTPAIIERPVTVVLTGAGVPRQVLAESQNRAAFCDGTFTDIGSWYAPDWLVPIVSEHWGWRFEWDGTGTIPGRERAILCELVDVAHENGRRVRFCGVPDRPAAVREAYWRVFTDAGVDMISASRLRPMARFRRREASRGVVEPDCVLRDHGTVRGPGRPVFAKIQTGTAPDPLLGERALDTASAR